MSSTALHVRAETKPLEHRSAITPSIAKKLVDAGYEVYVERSPLSIFKDEEYEGTGANLVETRSWTKAPKDRIIIGLKELPEEDFPLEHVHVQFAHCMFLMLFYNRLHKTVAHSLMIGIRLQEPIRLGKGPGSLPSWPRHPSGPGVP
jgi:alanine dehydrogenase